MLSQFRRDSEELATVGIKDGQELVLAVYHALAASPQWEKTLLVIAYDEHGGFFDHVAPPGVPDDDPQLFGRYGVRVPALVVSPWVEARAVSHTVLDHTSIIKTILLRFCPRRAQRARAASRAARAGRERRARAPHRGTGGARP